MSRRLLVGVCFAVCLLVAGASRTAPVEATTQAPRPRPLAISADDDAFLEDLSKRTFMFFWEQADPGTGIVRDRARTDGSPVEGGGRDVGSIASVGFGLSGLCIAAERGWIPRAAALDRARTTLRFFSERMTHERGWFYHFVNIRTGAREWSSELSSIDSALFVAGALTVRQCFADDREIPRLADAIYRRVDFAWMLAGDPLLLSHGWKPESGFLKSRWDHYCELMILYLLAIGSPTHPIPPESWRAWRRPEITFERYTYVGGPPPLFVHQYPARVGGLPRPPRARVEYRLVGELGDGHARASGVCRQPGQRVPRLHRPGLGYHGVGQPQGLRRLGRPAAHLTNRRVGRAGGAGRIADVRARHRAPGAARAAPVDSAIASTDATASPMPFTRPTAG